MATAHTPLHIGIVACSVEGASLCYRTILYESKQFLGEHNHPEVTLHSYPMAEHMAAIDRDDWAAVGELILRSAEKLQCTGADFLICPDNTVHQAIDLIRDRSPLPWLHIAEVVAAEAQRHAYKRVALTGTKYLMEGPVYGPRFQSVGIEMRIPTPDERTEINRIIFDELVYGHFLPLSEQYFQRLLARMQQDDGCDAAALCCTEIPLIINHANSPLPVLDSTRLLARAAVRHAVGATASELGRTARASFEH
jgi:aspartate racemase